MPVSPLWVDNQKWGRQHIAILSYRRAFRQRRQPTKRPTRFSGSTEPNRTKPNRTTGHHTVIIPWSIYHLNFIAHSLVFPRFSHNRCYPLVAYITTGACHKSGVRSATTNCQKEYWKGRRKAGKLLLSPKCSRERAVGRERKSARERERERENFNLKPLRWEFFLMLLSALKGFVAGNCGQRCKYKNKLYECSAHHSPLTMVVKQVVNAKRETIDSFNERQVQITSKANGK